MEEKMEEKNIFEYLEFSFKQIFSYDGQYKLRSSYIVAILSSIVSVLLWIAFILNGYLFIQSQFLTFSYLVYATGIFLLIFTIYTLEYSFYAIILPKKFQQSRIIRSNDYFGNIGMKDDIHEWGNHITTYLVYITLYGLAILVLPIVFMIGGGILLTITSSIGITIFYGTFGLFLFIYTMVRLSISWYGMLLLKESFAYGWRLLQGKVWRTFKFTFIFGLIIGLGAQIPGYISQLFIPDISHEILSIMNIIRGNMEVMRDSDFLVKLPLIFKEIYQNSGNIILGIYIFIFFSKISWILKIAIQHSFMTQYFLDQDKEFLQ